MRRTACGFFLRPVLARRRTTMRRTATGPSRHYVQTPFNRFPSISVSSELPVVAKRSVSPELISSKTMSTTVQSNDKDTLRGKTDAWLKIPVGNWTRKDLSMGRYLIRGWSESSTRSSGHDTLQEQAVAQTQIVRRWMEERRAKKGHGQNHSSSDSVEMVEMLNRCLDSWRKAAVMMPQTSWNNRTPQTESMELVQLFCDAGKDLDDKGLSPTSKTHSMCMNVLALYPESPKVCEDVLSLLDECKKTTKTDLQFYNVCLHTLAKCASHHPDVPTLVERIFQEMRTDSGLSPNTACFVSVLHAWANSITGNETTSLAAERAEAILDQMIRGYPKLVDTICFNICIDAWGKQGDPERAEAILRKLQQYHQDNPFSQSKTNVRPNQISFNSAINAWSKNASYSEDGNNDPQTAADRATLLLRQMRAHGMEPTEETYGCIMEAYSKTANPGMRVQSFLDELEKLYSEGKVAKPPPKICYLMAILAWGRTRSKPKGVERAEAIVQRLERICLQEGGEWAQLEPCTILYTALVSAWAQSDMDYAPERAKEIFQEMLQKSKMGRSNLLPNTITMNTVIESFCNHNRIDEAREFLESAKRVVSPDSKSYLIVLKAYAHSNSEDGAQKAQDVLSCLEDEYNYGQGTIKPTIHMYSQILVALGNGSRSDGAFRAEALFWELLRENDGNRVVPNTATLNCVLRAWSKSSEGGAAERAEAFLRKVQEEHSEMIVADPISHLHLIYAWAHSRRRKAPKEAEKHLDQARALCQDMRENSSWRLTKAHFNGVILAWKKSSDSNAGVRIEKLQRERDSATLV